MKQPQEDSQKETLSPNSAFGLTLGLPESKSLGDKGQNQAWADQPPGMSSEWTWAMVSLAKGQWPAVIQAREGYDLEHRGPDGRTLLHWACAWKMDQGALDLILAGASTRARDAENKTPKDLASPDLAALIEQHEKLRRQRILATLPRPSGPPPEM